MPRARVRRPLVALIILILALVIGYAVRAVRSDGEVPARSMQPSVSQAR